MNEKRIITTQPSDDEDTIIHSKFGNFKEMEQFS